jgi:hypothetical protein
VNNRKHIVPWFWLVPGNWRKRQRWLYRIVPETRWHMNESARVLLLNCTKAVPVGIIIAPLVAVEMIGEAASKVLQSPPAWLRFGDRSSLMMEAKQIVSVEEVRRRMIACGWQYDEN